MRILAVGNMYPPHHLGGYELVWQSVMRRARHYGHNVRILTSDYAKPSVGGSEEPDVHRDLRWYWSWERNEWVRLDAWGRLQLERGNARALRRHLDDFRPDVLSWWSMGAMSLGLIEQVQRRGIPSVLAVHDDWLVYGPRRDAWMRVWNGRRRLMAGPVARITGLPTAIHPERWGRFLFNSRYTLESARRAGIEIGDYAVVHPGIETRFLEPAPEHPWSWRLRYVGRIDQNKGLEAAVQALSRLPPTATLTMIGDGHPDYLDRLQVLSAEAGTAHRVVHEPFIEAHQLPAAYAEADAIVFPVRWKEPWGLVPLEAMGLGRPVIATARGGPKEYLVDGENALVVPPDDPSAIAEAVNRLANDPSLRSRLIEGGRRTAVQFTAKDFELKIVQELERAAGWGPNFPTFTHGA